MAIADLAHQGHEGLVWHDHATGAEHRLHDEGRDRVGTLEGDLVLELAGDGRSDLGRIGRVERVAVGIGRGEMDDAGQ